MGRAAEIKNWEEQVKNTKSRAAGSARTVAGLAAVMTVCGVGVAQAFDVPTGNSDLRIRFDNTIRYNLGIRAESIDSRIVGNPNYDESDMKFERGDVVTNRVDLLTELDVIYRDRYGARVTAGSWYDAAYSDTDITKGPSLSSYPSSYYGDKYSDNTKRFHRGPSGEILDAFLFGGVDLGSVPVDVKIGRHTVYWGEGLLFGSHAISYSQAPLDGRKAVSSPGIETKEVFLPIGQISAKAQLSPDLSIAGQYFFEWEPTRAASGGTYLSSADFFGADRIPLAPGFARPHLGDILPDESGNWGVSARYRFDAIDGTVGVYYREFDDYTPGVYASASGYRLVYQKDVKVIGLSYGTIGLGGASIGAEVSYRKNGALNSTTFLPSDDYRGARGNTWHAVANAVWLLDRSPVYDTGNVVVELAYSRLGEVTHNESLYKGKGYASCATSSALAGCSTRDYAAIAINFTPQWLQVFPSLDIDLPMTVNYGLTGNAPSASGGNEGTLSWSLGVKATYQQRHELTLRYADQHADGIYSANTLVGGRGSPQLNDRGYLTLTYKTAF